MRNKALIASLLAIWVVGAVMAPKSPQEANMGELEASLSIVQGNSIVGVSVPAPLNIEPLGTRVVTAYSSDPNETDDTPFLTAAQTPVRTGVIACPRYIEFGSEIIIDGETYICEDRMNLKHPHRFDIWMESKEEALNWGKKKVEVWLKN